MGLNKKQSRILETATRLFICNGYKDTSVMDIANTAKVSQVTLYKYFDHKFNLAEQVWVEIIRNGYAEFFEKLDNEEVSFEDCLSYLINHKQAYIERIHPDYFDFFLNELKKKDSPIQLAYDEQKGEFFRKFIELGRKAGMISPSLSDNSLYLYLDMIATYFQNHEQQTEEHGNLIRKEYNNLLHLMLFGFFGETPDEQLKKRLKKGAAQ